MSFFFTENNLVFIIWLSGITFTPPRTVGHTVSNNCFEKLLLCIYSIVFYAFTTLPCSNLANVTAWAEAQQYPSLIKEEKKIPPTQPRACTSVRQTVSQGDNAFSIMLLSSQSTATLFGGDLWKYPLASFCVAVINPTHSVLPSSVRFDLTNHGRGMKKNTTRYSLRMIIHSSLLVWQFPCGLSRHSSLSPFGLNLSALPWLPVP